jgi:uncharacterized membrane protein YfcA
MSAQTIFLLVITGLSAGVLSGIIGGGSGIIIVPALVLLFGFSQKEAQGTSLSILLLLIGVFCVFEYYQQRRINITYALIVALAFFAGAYIGGKYSFSLNEQKLKRIFAIAMMLLSIRMLFFDKPKTTNAPSTVSTTRTTAAGLK